MSFSIVREKLLSTLLNTSSKTKIAFPCNSFNKSSKQPKCSVFSLGYHSFATVPFGGKLERIPYSKKFCLVSSLDEKDFVKPEKEFREEVKKKWKWSLLPMSDWRVIRVESVARKMLAAMNEGLMLDEAYKINGNVHEPQRRKMWELRRLIWKPVTEHLNGRQWEFYVAEDMGIYTFCGPCGRITVNALVHDNILSDYLMVDQEGFIATLLGHEIGNVVAKNFLRRMYMYQCYGVLLLCAIASGIASALFGTSGIFHFVILLPVAALLGVLFQRFLMRRNFAEVDYIGLMLMASAGYDPRIAPMVYEKIDSNRKEDLFSIFYSGRKRAKLLNRDEVMKQALEIYEEAKAGKRVRIFV